MLQGFGSFPLNFRALIQRSRELGDDIDWSIICSTGHYVKMYQDLLGPDAVLYLHSDMKHHLKEPDLLSRLGTYHGNIYRNIESEKRFTKHKKASRQLRSAAAMYVSMKEFMERRKPTHVLFGQIEGMDGMTLISVASEMGIPSMVPSHTRHMGETFLSPDHLETIPHGREITQEHRAQAREFLANFRSGQTSAGRVPDDVEKGPENYYPVSQKPFAERVLGVIRRLIEEPEMREPDVFRASLFVNFPWIANIFWKTRRFFNSRVYDISSLGELPEVFAYYPLQYSPESSINTPAPYYIDQTRVIDAIRFALPSHMRLVVKEHPTCMGLRPLGFLNRLQKKAGVVMARYDMPSTQIAEKAAITFSVSGTASFEAFLKGKPSLALGGCFFSEALGGITSIDNLPHRISESLNNPPADEFILEFLARVYSVSSPFIMGSPFDRDSGFSRYCLKETNIHNFFDAVKAEVSRVS